MLNQIFKFIWSFYECIVKGGKNPPPPPPPLESATVFLERFLKKISKWPLVEVDGTNGNLAIYVMVLIKKKKSRYGF
jgi:hypothetical protein